MCRETRLIIGLGMTNKGIRKFQFFLLIHLQQTSTVAVFIQWYMVTPLSVNQFVSLLVVASFVLRTALEFGQLHLLVSLL